MTRASHPLGRRHGQRRHPTDVRHRLPRGGTAPCRARCPARRRTLVPWPDARPRRRQHRRRGLRADDPPQVLARPLAPNAVHHALDAVPVNGCSPDTISNSTTHSDQTFVRLVGRPAVQHLGGQVAQRAASDSHVMRRSGQAEVDQLRQAVGREADVARLDVAVEIAGPVQTPRAPRRDGPRRSRPPAPAAVRCAVERSTVRRRHPERRRSS